MAEEELAQATSKKEDLLIEAKKFFNAYKEDLGQSLRKRENVLFVDFMLLTEFSSALSDEILTNPLSSEELFIKLKARGMDQITFREAIGQNVVQKKNLMSKMGYC